MRGFRPVAYPVDGVCNLGRGYGLDMTSVDDDDWTGEPPEGRHAASRAKPDFWKQNRAPLSITGIGVGVAIIILVIVWLL